MVVTPERFNRESRTRRLDSPPDRVAGWPLKTSGNDNSSFRGVFEMASRDSDENPSFATPATTILSEERDAVKRQKSPRHEEKSFDSVSFCETS